MSDFVKSPMDYVNNGTDGGPGDYNGDPNFPKRSSYGSGVTEKTYEGGDKWNMGKGEAVGSPVMDRPVK